MTIERTRRERLEQLIKELGRGKLKDMAEKVGRTPNYITQLRSPSKSFGSAIARELEKRAGKPRGWMDTPVEAASGRELAGEGPADEAGLELPNDVQALRYAVGAMAAIMAAMRPTEGAAVAALLRSKSPPEYLERGVGMELLKVLDSAVQAAQPSSKRAPGGQRR